MASAPTSAAERRAAVARLTMYGVPAPPVRVPRVETVAVYPQVRSTGVDLRAVNTALRAVVLTHERSWELRAREDRARLEGVFGDAGPSWAYSEPGRYQSRIDPELASASTTVVSVLLSVVNETFAGQPGGEEWLAANVLVPSGELVAISDLFKNVYEGMLVLERAWKRARPCARAYWQLYTPRLVNYHAFALTPAGLAVGSREAGACGPMLLTVPYRLLRAYLSELGARLAAEVRRPRFERGVTRPRPAAAVFVQALPNRVELRPDLETAVPWRKRLGFTVTVAAEGARRDAASLTIALRQGRSTIVRTAKLPAIPAGKEASVVFASMGPLARDGPALLKVRVTPGSDGRWRDAAAYPIVFAPTASRDERRVVELVAATVLPRRQILLPRVENAIRPAPNLRFAVAVENKGSETEHRVEVRLRLDQKSATTQTTTIDRIAPGQQRTVVFRPRKLDVTMLRTIWISVVGVPGATTGTSYPVDVAG